MELPSQHNCEICGSGPFNDGSSLYRNGPKGQIVPWRCWEHLEQQWKDEIEPDTKLLVEIISGGE